MKDTILSISGKPGLYKLVSNGRGNLIVETIDATKKRVAAGVRDRITALNDVSMYSTEDDVELFQVFQNLADKHNGAPIELNHKQASEEQLRAMMSDALPNYDEDRVRISDMRKLLQWYNILASNGYSQFVEAGEEPEVSATE